MPHGPSFRQADAPSLEFFHVTDEQGSGEALTCVGVASSGDGIALGSASGACIQMGHGDKDVRANLSSRPSEGPERPPPRAKVQPETKPKKIASF